MRLPLIRSLSASLRITVYIQLQDSILLSCEGVLFNHKQKAARAFMKTKGSNNSACLGMTDSHVTKVREIVIRVG